MIKIKDWLQQYLEGRTVSSKQLFKDAIEAGYKKSTIVKTLERMNCSVIRNNSSGKDFYWCLDSGHKRWTVVEYEKIDDWLHDRTEDTLSFHGYVEVEEPVNKTPLPRTWFYGSDQKHCWTEEG